MNEAKLFSYDTFISLAGCELAKYMEPFVNERVETVPEATYELLRSRLAGMDDEHALYALELGMLVNPDEFVHQAVLFLAHTDAGVCSTAYRLINRLKPTAISADVISSIVATPKVDLFAPNVYSGVRMCIGTNEKFIHDLVVKLAGQKRSDD